MAGIEDLLEYYIGKDPLYDIYKQKGLIDPSNIKAYEEDPRKIAEPWKLAPTKRSTAGYTYSKDEDDPSLYIKDLDKFGMQPSGPLYGKPTLDKEWLDTSSWSNKVMGVDKFGNEITRPLSNRERMTEYLNASKDSWKRDFALQQIDPTKSWANPSITERNKQIAETIGHEARHQVAGAGQTGYETDAQGNYIYPDFKVPSHAFSEDLPELGGQRKSELLNRMLDFQAYNNPRIYDDVYGTEYTKGTQGGKYTDTFGAEIEGMPRQLTSYQADALSNQANAFTDAMLAQSAPKYANLTGTADALASTPDNLAIKDFIPQTIKNLFSKKEDSLQLEEAEDVGIETLIPRKNFLRRIFDSNLMGRIFKGGGLSPSQQGYINRYGRNPQTGRMTSGPFRGQNLFGTSMFGSKTAKEQALKNLNKWGKTAPDSRVKQWENVVRGDRAAGTGTTVTGHGKSGMGRDPRDRMKYGGLATMFERRR